ncbi:MAG: S-layer homology domain-containing protein [Clostridia bacterium]|nr:S-layer homology domain-containing protein [Clostridia bacterium]
MKMFNRRIVSVIIAVVTILTASAITSLPVGATSRSVSDAYYYNYYGNYSDVSNNYSIDSNTVESSNTWRWPITNQIFGRGFDGTHKAVDIVAPSGQTVMAAKEGTVVCATTASASASYRCPSCSYTGAGYHVVIRHPDGFYSFYAHLSSVNTTVGAYVKSGQSIGAVGSTGNSTGPHLHFAISSEGLYSLVDPLVYITPFSSVTANVSSNDVVITGNFGAWGPTMQTAGFYIGTSKTNMTKVTETLNTNGYVNGVAIQNIFYSMSKWYPYLKQGNTYYYKMYITRNGKEYCSDIYSFSYGTHTHSWDSGITTQWPTCTQNGTRVYSCTGCNATKTETISAKGHQYGSWTTVKEATIAQDGESRTYCSNCDAYKTKRIPRLSENLSSDFDDVKSDSWYKPYIDYAYTYGLLKGTGVRQMQPERTVTRAEFVQILASLAGVNTSNKNVFSGFADVKPGQWYTPAVKWASENGIVSGISATKFAPNNKITREQMCTMLVKFIENYMHITIKNKNQKTTFTDDAFISSWAKYSVYKCQTGGLVSGVSASLFAPKNYATRASAAVIISQFHAEYAK